MRVSVDEFLARVAALYDAPLKPGQKGTVALSCKSVPAVRVFPKEAVHDANVLLFRAAKYGNNHHKIKYSVVVSSSAQAAFHSQLSSIVKAKAEYRRRKIPQSIGMKRLTKKAAE